MILYGMRCELYVSRANRKDEGGSLLEIESRRFCDRYYLNNMLGVELDRFGSVVAEKDLVSIWLVGHGRRGLTVDEGVGVSKRKGKWLKVEMPIEAGVTEVGLVRHGIRYQFIAMP